MRRFDVVIGGGALVIDGDALAAAMAHGGDRREKSKPQKLQKRRRRI